MPPTCQTRRCTDALHRRISAHKPAIPFFRAAETGIFPESPRMHLRIVFVFAIRTAAYANAKYACCSSESGSTGEICTCRSLTPPERRNAPVPRRPYARATRHERPGRDGQLRVDRGQPRSGEPTAEQESAAHTTRTGTTRVALVSPSSTIVHADRPPLKTGLIGDPRRCTSVMMAYVGVMVQPSGP